MKKWLVTVGLSMLLITVSGCLEQQANIQTTDQKAATDLSDTQKESSEFKGDGWTISYPSTWNKVGDGFIQEEKTGKTLNFNIENTTKEDLEKWIDSEISRALAATEASNTIKDPLKVEQKEKLWYYTYSVECKMDGAVYILKHTIIFDGERKYHFYTSIPPLTEEEYSAIIGSFRIL